MFERETGACPSEVPFRCTTIGRATSLTHKYRTRMKRLAKDKHSSLVWSIINYLIFITLDPDDLKITGNTKKVGLCREALVKWKAQYG
jgi:hypothetical protein